MRSFLLLVTGIGLLCVTAIFAEFSFARGGGGLACLSRALPWISLESAQIAPTTSVVPRKFVAYQ